MLFYRKADYLRQDLDRIEVQGGHSQNDETKKAGMYIPIYTHTGTDVTNVYVLKALLVSN